MFNYAIAVLSALSVFALVDFFPLVSMVALFVFLSYILQIKHLSILSLNCKCIRALNLSLDLSCLNDGNVTCHLSVDPLFFLDS